MEEVRFLVGSIIQLRLDLGVESSSPTLGVELPLEEKIKHNVAGSVSRSINTTDTGSDPEDEV